MLACALPASLPVYSIVELAQHNFEVSENEMKCSGEVDDGEYALSFDMEPPRVPGRYHKYLGSLQPWRVLGYAGLGT